MTVNGLVVPYGQEAVLVATPEVGDCIAAGLLLPRSEDGTYPAPAAVEPSKCCGR